MSNVKSILQCEQNLISRDLESISRELNFISCDLSTISRNQGRGKMSFGL
jgi:hypothetical protein